jgi:hypothetical protein
MPTARSDAGTGAGAERRNQELDSLEQSMSNTQDERTRLQLHSNETTKSLVALRQELDESRAATGQLRASEEAGRQQLARMMNEQLAQNQTIEALRRPVETSNNATRDAQALLRATQDQQQQLLRMPPPSIVPAAVGGTISNTPFVPPPSAPTRDLQGSGQEIYMALIIIILVRHLTRDMLSRCGTCMVHRGEKS